MIVQSDQAKGKKRRILSPKLGPQGGGKKGANLGHFELLSRIKRRGRSESRRFAESISKKEILRGPLRNSASSAFTPTPQSKKDGAPSGCWSAVVRICDHPSGLARSFSKRKSTAPRGRRVGRRRSNIQVSGPPLLTKTSERPHCNDRRKDFYNNFWPPSRIATQCKAPR